MAASVAALSSRSARRASSARLGAAARGSAVRRLFVLTVGALAIWGGQHRVEEIWVADEGVGYAFGVAGGVLLLVTPLYALRKRLRLLRSLGRLPVWFRGHMVSGVVGPLLILFHCNFRAGSTNATAALVAMLLVVASGLVGRYLYGKIHRALDGRRAALGELLVDSQITGLRLDPLLAHAPSLQARMRLAETAAQAPVAGLVGSGRRHAVVMARTHAAAVASTFLLARTVREQAHARGWGPNEQLRRWLRARRAVRAHLSAVRRVTEFGFYERLFTLWHLLHLPLFFLLVLAAVAHVVAVHLY